MKRSLAALLLAAALAGAAHAQPTEALTIASGDKTHAFQVEIADSKEERAKGLSGRAALAETSGMVLDFRAAGEEPLAVNMKGVTIPLDMLFLGRDGSVLAIAENARPGSLRNVTPGVPYVAVLEIPGGRAAALAIKPGAKVRHRLFGNGG